MSDQLPISQQDSESQETPHNQSFPDPQIAADYLAKGETIQDSLAAAGYSKHRQRQGTFGISKKTLELLSKKNQGYAVIGRLFSAEQRAQIVRGKLLENVSTGKDSATKSCELLGKDTEVAIFKSDQSNVSVQIAIPVSMQGLFAAESGEVENKSDPQTQDS